VATYIVITIAYTINLKHVPVVDVVTVAAGFVLRAAAGAAAVDVPMSRWFVLCITFGSLFIVVGKRYAELNEVGEDAGTRATLEEYTVGYLRIMLSVSLGGVLISYCVWAFETSEASDTDLPLYELSIVPMLMALMRYLLVLERGEGAAPEEVFTRDRLLQFLGLCWLVVYGLAVYVS
jgi:decaprenyl-phosphate phosphoribosyltransferase